MPVQSNEIVARWVWRQPADQRGACITFVARVCRRIGFDFRDGVASTGGSSLCFPGVSCRAVEFSQIPTCTTAREGAGFGREPDPWEGCPLAMK